MRPCWSRRRIYMHNFLLIYKSALISVVSVRWDSSCIHAFGFSARWDSPCTHAVGYSARWESPCTKILEFQRIFCYLNKKFPGISKSEVGKFVAGRTNIFPELPFNYQICMSASILYIFLHASDYQRADTSRATVHLDSQRADASRAIVHLDSQRADTSRATVHATTSMVTEKK